MLAPVRSLPRWLVVTPGLSGLILLGACIAIAPDGNSRPIDEVPDAGDEGTISLDATPPENPPPEAGTPDPHAVNGASPSHAPFAGGWRVLVNGKGFTSKARVWFGPNECDPTTTLPIDPGRVQVTLPPGQAGLTDVTVQNGDDESTKRTLKGGFTYDALYAQPDTGPVPGGTVIEILGQGTSWNGTTIAKIDQKPCSTLIVENATTLTCTVPAGTPGSKTITVTTGNETITVLDAYTYEDSDNGYKGGLSGDPLAGHLKVLVYDNWTGDPVPGAQIFVGQDIATALQATADFSGVAVLDDPLLNSPQTVTVTGLCHSPISFVAEPVDTVTAYLDPVLTPACAGNGDPVPVGGKPVNYGNIMGELVWEGAIEFKKADWTNIPNPIGANEKQVAYVFVGVADPTTAFQLPPDGTQILPTTPGDSGYQFAVSLPAGNRSLYALAGLEDRTVSPPKFTAYAMGAVKGVPVLPGEVTENVYISMTKTLDQALVMDVKSPPPGPKGPDRLKATVSISIANESYAILPIGLKVPYLPVQGALPFVGVPSLDTSLSGAFYSSAARAVTGDYGQPPLSVISRKITTSTSQTVDMTSFVGVPSLATPSVNGAWDGTHLTASFPAGGPSIDLTVFEVISGNGLMHWTVALPAGVATAILPDLSGFPELAIPPGPVLIGVYGAHIDDFEYGKLLYRNLRPVGMSAYSYDVFNAHL